MSGPHHFLPYWRRGAAASIDGAKPVEMGRPLASITRSVTLTAKDGTSREDTNTLSYHVLGPGDLTGLSGNQVVRMVPRPETHNFEPNYLAHVEFAHPDLPWLFSPTAPGDRHQLSPWIALVVLEEESGTQRVRARVGSPNPVVEAAIAELPDLTEAWAWAHVQIAPGDIDPVEAVKAWESNCGLVLSRLISPRRLQADRSWVACVVPTYALGVQAGLGAAALDAQGDATGLKRAWPTQQPTVVLPVFHSWRFRTGPAGDFETLAQKLKGVKPSADVGERTVYLDPRLGRFPASAEFAPVALRVGTAIAKASGAGPLSPLAPAPDAERRPVVGAALKRVLNVAETERHEGIDRPVVGPPIYGQWHAQRPTLDDAPDNAQPVLPDRAAWLTELNADPETRAVAALGTRMVQRDQEALMASAWNQLQALAEANRRARWALMFMSSAVHLHAKRLATRTPANALRLAMPALGRLRVEERATVATQVAATKMPLTVVGANFTRATRYATQAIVRGTLIGAVVANSSRQLDALVTPMLAGTLQADAPRFGQRALLAPPDFAQLLTRAGLTNGAIQAATGLTLDQHVQNLTNLRSLIDATQARIEIVQPQPQPAPPQAAGPNRVDPSVFGRFTLSPGQVTQLQQHVAGGIAVQQQPGIAFSLSQRLRRVATNQAPAIVDLSAADLSLIAAAQQVDQNAGGAIALSLDNPRIKLRVNAAERDQLFEFVRSTDVAADKAKGVATYATVRSAVMAQFHQDVEISPQLWGADPAAVAAAIGGLKRPVTFDAQRDLIAPSAVAVAATLKQSVVTLLEPTSQYKKMLAWAITLPAPRYGLRRRSPVHETMAAPRFDDPAVNRLKQLDRNWILGHSDQLPPNSISILVANSRFVEAFLVGASYEMARELQWRRYPTDMMGTCFPRFWPTPPGSPDDIKPIPDWDGQLGSNGPANDVHPGEDVVVVVRGDLLRHYPNTVITALRGKATESAAGTTFVRDPQTPSVRELFRDFLDPDITYAGLAVTLGELTAPSNDGNSWFIALTQPIDEPKFGLDDNPGAHPAAVGKISDLAWQNIPAELVRTGNLSVSGNITGQENWAVPAGNDRVIWGPASHAGEIASILMQQPFQVLLKASDYL